MRKKIRMIAAALACCLAVGCSDTPAAPEVQGSETNTQEGGDSDYIETLTPANDYYGYINAKELMNMSIKPGESSIGTLDIVADETEEQLKEIIASVANSSEDFAKGSHEQAIHDLYWLANDRMTGVRDDDEADTAFADAIVERIYSPESVEELFDMWHKLRLDYGFQPFYSSENTVDLYNTDETVLCFGFEALVDLEEIRENQVRAVRRRDELAGGLQLLGIGAEDAKDRANDIILTYFEIAGSTDMSILNGDKETYEYYNILSREECNAVLKNISYEQLISSYGLKGVLPESVLIPDPDQLAAVDSVMDSDHLQVWKDITFLKFLSEHAAMMPDKYKTTDTGTEKTTEDLTFMVVNGYLRDAVADLYAEKYFTEKKQRLIRKMCDDIVLEYHDLISGSGWISDDGKAYLTDKLDHMEFYIGWGGERCDLDPVFSEISGSTLYQAAFMIDRAAAMEEIAQFGKKNDEDGFKTMPASTVNACYRPQYNDIVITAAILNQPVFDENAEYAWNLGAIGSIIGHEISHGFDSKGVLYDANGNFRPDAMPKEDIDAFREIQQKAVEYYNGFKVLGSHVNGKNTLGENLADISGLQCMLSIAENEEDKKIILESYAHLWKKLISDTYAKELLEEDVHSPAGVRVNAVVACFDEYYTIYDVKEGDDMYVAPEDRVKRW